MSCILDGYFGQTTLSSELFQHESGRWKQLDASARCFVLLTSSWENSCKCFFLMECTYIAEWIHFNDSEDDLKTCCLLCQDQTLRQCNLAQKIQHEYIDVSQYHCNYCANVYIYIYMCIDHCRTAWKHRTSSLLLSFMMLHWSSRNASPSPLSIQVNTRSW